MFLLLFICLFGIVVDETITVGAGQAWYEQQAAKAASIEGILDYQAGSGRIGVPAGYAPFRVVRKDTTTGKLMQYSVHAPGFEPVLALQVGQRVIIEGKVISQGEGATAREEIWIGKLQPMGVAPINVFTELKPIARTNRFIPTSIQVGTDTGKLVMRSSKDVAKALGQRNSEPEFEREANNHLTTLFAVKSIDWNTQMVIYVGSLFQRNARLTKIEITKLDVHEKGITVYWKAEEGLRQVAPSVSDTVLIPKVEGEVTFKQEDNKKPAGARETAPANEKLIPIIPGAPVK